MDEGYIRDAGQAVAHFLHAGQPCELAYTPGNMTLYELVLTPAWSLHEAASWMDHERRRSITKDRPELQLDPSQPDAWVILSWVGHGAWPLDLRAVPFGNYLAEKFDSAGAQADGEAIRRLLVEVSKAMRFPTVAAVS